MNAKRLTMMAVGDVILDTSPPAERLLESVAPILKTGDVVVGQGELPFTSRGVDTFVDMFVPGPACHPDNMSAFSASGFNMITLNTNHIYDVGPAGVEDTIAGLQKLGIAYTGAGMNIDEARRPAVIERDGTRFGFLAYNCVGPIGSWATTEKPGCAYVHIITAYEVGLPVVGGYPTVYTFAEPGSMQAMSEDIRKLRPLCDVLVVSLHKGIGFIPASIAMYEQQVSYAAIDAGADLILGHHAHIIKGVEFYKGKAIFHGLGNFVFAVENTLSGRAKTADEKQAFVQEFVKRHGGPFFFGPGGKELPFPPPESDLTMIAKCTIEHGRVSKVSYLPGSLTDHVKPEIFGNDERGQKVFEYMANITKGAGLNARYEWDGNEIAIYPGN